MSGLEKFLRVDDLAILCDGEVQVRRHGSLSAAGVTGSAVMGVVTGGSVTLVGVLSAEEGSSIQ